MHCNWWRPLRVTFCTHKTHPWLTNMANRWRPPWERWQWPQWRTPRDTGLHQRTWRLQLERKSRSLAPLWETRGGGSPPVEDKGRRLSPCGDKGRRLSPCGDKGMRLSPCGDKGMRLSPCGDKGRRLSPCGEPLWRQGNEPLWDEGMRLSPSGDKGMRLNLFCHCITKLTRITCDCYVHDGVMSTLTVINFNGGSRSGEGRREEHDSGVVGGKSRGRMWFVTLQLLNVKQNLINFSLTGQNNYSMWLRVSVASHPAFPRLRFCDKNLRRGKVGYEASVLVRMWRCSWRPVGSGDGCWLDSGSETGQIGENKYVYTIKNRGEGKRV